ncbi:receptor protein EIX2 [Trifolium repens]|nr:receptor protein EIX2 [Trifolium repens]
MTILTTQMSLLLLLLLSLTTFHKTIDGQLTTWSTEKDCCAWEGVHCDNITKRVTELDLSYQELKATQHNITHASNLFYLDLSLNFGAHMDNLDWLSPLSSLKYLNLSRVDLHKETNWLQAVNTLPSLLELQLHECYLN